MRITAHEYPRLYESLTMIAHDNVACSCQEHQGKGWDVWVYQPVRLTRIEASLAPLSHDELETLCTGEETEIVALVERYQLHETQDFLEYFFDNLGA